MNAIHFIAFAPLALATALAQQASVLAHKTDSLPQLIEKLKHDDAKVRTAAVQALKDLASKANMAVPELIRSLEDNDQQVRNLAYRALEQIGPEAAPELVRVLKSKAATKTKAATELRVQIVRILGNVRHESKIAEAALLEIFDDPDSKFKERTIVVMSSPPPVLAALPRFVAILEDKRSTGALRGTAINCLARFGAPAKNAVPLIWEVWHDKSENYLARWAAAGALVALTRDDAALVPSLRKVLIDRHEQWLVRGAAAQSLGNLGSLAESAIPDLAAVVKEKIVGSDRDSWNDFRDFTRSLCITAIAEIGPNSKTALQAVLDIAQSTTTDNDMRANAIRVFPKFSSDETVSVLIDILTKEQFERDPVSLRISYAAVRTFAAMGPRAKAAAPILERIVNTRDQQLVQLRVEALGALDLIRGK